MLVGDWMKRNPVTVSPQDSLAVAQGKMRAGRFRQLPVVSAKKLVGIITDRDLRQHGREMRVTNVSAAMTEGVITVTPQTPLEAAVRILLERKIGGLPVLDEDRVVGIITTSDILKAFLDLVELDLPLSPSV
jgi:acetoin utilization protein AcuB